MLLLVAAAGMLYVDHNEVSRANPSEDAATRQEPGHPLGTDGSGGADVYPDVAHEDQAASPSGNSGGLHAMSSPAESSEPQKQDRTDPVVYVHVSQERDWPLLEEIGGALRDNGYSVPVTRYARGRTRGDVRFFFLQDRREAERIKSVVESELGRRGYPMSLELLERDGRRFEFAAPGKIEVWLPALRSAQS
jgi:hypothetical protein